MTLVPEKLEETLRYDILTSHLKSLCESYHDFRTILMEEDTSTEKTEKAVDKPFFIIKFKDSEETLACFYPQGKYECYDSDFAPFFDEIVVEVEKKLNMLLKGKK